jgi:transposase
VKQEKSTLLPKIIQISLMKSRWQNERIIKHIYRKNTGEISILILHVTSIGFSRSMGIFMKYSYEYKRSCVELYRQGKWPETPEGAKVKRFHNTIRTWVRIEDACGPEALQHQNQNKIWTAEEKYELVAKILAGASVNATAIAAGINKGLLYQWVRCYRMKGYQGLLAQRKGRPPKEPDMKKKIEPAELTPSEREEMIRLRAENERLRAEIAVVKKGLP